MPSFEQSDGFLGIVWRPVPHHLGGILKRNGIVWDEPLEWDTGASTMTTTAGGGDLAQLAAAVQLERHKRHRSNLRAGLVNL